MDGTGDKATGVSRGEAVRYDDNYVYLLTRPAVPDDLDGMMAINNAADPHVMRRSSRS